MPYFFSPLVRGYLQYISARVSFFPCAYCGLTVVPSVWGADTVADKAALGTLDQMSIQRRSLTGILSYSVATFCVLLPDPCQRFQVNNLRRAARKGVLKLTITDALVPLFARLDLALRAHFDRHSSRRMLVIASDDSAWLVRAFVNSRSSQWLAEVPLDAAVLVGSYHKSIVGELALDVYPHRPRINQDEDPGTAQPGECAVKFYSLNAREGGRARAGGDSIDLEAAVAMEASISCMSFEEDSESCILQEYEVEDRGWLSLLGSTSLLSLWVPRVLRG